MGIKKVLLAPMNVNGKGRKGAAFQQRSGEGDR